MLKRYAYAWLTLGFFLGSLVLHWYFGWIAYLDDAKQHGVAADSTGYLA